MQNTKDYVKLFFKQNKFVAFVSALVFIILSTTYSIVSWIMQVIFDYMAGNSTYSFESILLMLGGYLLVAALLFMIQRSVYPRFLEKAMNQYKEAVIKKLFKKSYSDFLITNSGTYLSVLTNDCERILETYLKNIFEFIQNIVMVVSSLTLMLYYNSLLTIIAIVIAMIPMVCSLLTARSIATREEQVSKTNESYVSLTKDILNGISVIKSFKVENEAISRYQNKSMQLEHTKKMREQTFTVVSACGTIAYMVTQFGVMVIGAWMIHEHIGTMTAGMILAFINLMNGILQPINALPRIYGGMSGAKKLITKMSDYMSNAKEDTGETIVQPLANIALQDVSYAYDTDHTILKHINLQLQAGKSYAVVGPSGAGKSSLINLLMGYYQNYDGSVHFNNYELKQISKYSLYEKITLMQQSVFIFDASIWDNITLFKQFPAAEVDRVIHLAGLDHLISQKGRDYQCGENGSHLSGGEKQRIAIARSLLKKSEILLVDEATSALDNETSANVTQSILDLQGILRLVVTHRLDASSLKQYDEILVMKDGALIERGNFDTLMDSKEYFYSLYTISK